MKDYIFYTIVTQDSVNVKYKYVVPFKSTTDRFHLDVTEGTAVVDVQRDRAKYVIDLRLQHTVSHHASLPSKAT